MHARLWLTVGCVAATVLLTACKCPRRGAISSKGVLKIVVQPEDQIVRQGNTATFVVVAEPAPLEYQWKRNGVNVPGATNAILTIPSANFTNAGIYTCLVTKNPQKETEAAELTVYSTTAPAGVTGTFQKLTSSKSCIGSYKGYAKFKSPTGSSWWVPATGKTSCVITDTSSYATIVEAIEYPSMTNWCASKTLTFSLTAGSKYAFTTYVTQEPLPAVNEVLVLNIDWRP